MDKFLKRNEASCSKEVDQAVSKKPKIASPKGQGFSLASAIRHSPKIVPDVREFAVQFGQFVQDDFRKHMLYGNAQ